MTTVTIRYYAGDISDPEKNRLLGSETIEGIDEVLIPSNNKGTPIFITKSFTGEPCKRWQVQRVVSEDKENWAIWLSNRDNNAEVYLSETLRLRSKRSAQGFLKKGSIVIVEFGHIYQTLSLGAGTITENTTYFCNHLSGEMHKRRPAIVISADDRGVKVVPITSQEPAGFTSNKSIFELESQSTMLINEFNPAKGSFVLCEMIQTVSPTRILPPLAKDLKRTTRTFRRDDSYIRQISSNDLRTLEEGLLTAVGMTAVKKRNQELLRENDHAKKELDESNSRQEELAVQLTAAREAEASLQHEIGLLKKRLSILSDLYLASSEHTAIEGVNAEVAEFLELDIIGF